MAKVYLGFTDREFWNCTPRKLIAMIEQWKLIEGRGKKQEDVSDILDAIPEEI